MRGDRLYIEHVLECLQKIEEYCRGGRETFLGSGLIQDAVVRNLQVLAESTQRLSEAVKGSCPKVDWTAISGLRNVLVHDYLGIGPERIWEIVELDLPGLQTEITKLRDTQG